MIELAAGVQMPNSAFLPFPFIELESSYKYWALANDQNIFILKYCLKNKTTSALPNPAHNYSLIFHASEVWWLNVWSLKTY